MYSHMSSFKRACMSAKPSAFDSTVGEKMAEISMAALEKAATLADLGKQVRGVADRLFETFKGTSCSSGYIQQRISQLSLSSTLGSMQLFWTSCGLFHNHPV